MKAVNKPAKRFLTAALGESDLWCKRVKMFFCSSHSTFLPLHLYYDHPGTFDPYRRKHVVSQKHLTWAIDAVHCILMFGLKCASPYYDTIQLLFSRWCVCVAYSKAVTCYLLIRWHPPLQQSYSKPFSNTYITVLLSHVSCLSSLLLLLPRWLHKLLSNASWAMTAFWQHQLIFRDRIWWFVEIL